MESLLLNSEDSFTDGCENSDDFSRLADLISAAGDGDAIEMKNLTQNRDLSVNVQAHLGLSPLHIAASLGHTEVSSILIAAGANVDLVTVDGKSPVSMAAENGCCDVVRELIRSQADINIPTLRGETPIMSAVFSNHQEIVDILIAAQADVDFQQIDSASPMYIASQEDQTSVVCSLVRAQADPDCKINDGSTALHIAAENGNGMVVSEILKVRPQIDTRNLRKESALLTAAQYGNVTALRSLIEAGADVNSQQTQGASALYIACQQGDSEIVDCLIRSYADPDIAAMDNVSPLYCAATVQSSMGDIFDKLIAAQCNLDVRRSGGDTLLYIAAQKGAYKQVEALINAGADVDIQDDMGMSPLHIAAQNGHHSIARLLIGAQASVDLKQNLGATPLYIAAENGHYKLVSLLVDSQADVDVRSYSGSAPIHIASQNGHLQVVQVLLRGRADLNAQNNEGCSPIYMASQNGHHQVVSILIASQADVNRQMNTGLTPLYAAVQNGHIRNVELLISARADVNLQDELGNSPLILAAMLGSVKCLKALICAMADVDIRNQIGRSPIFFAAKQGHADAVKALICGRVSVNATDVGRNSPAFIASRNGHLDVLDELIKAGADVELPDNNGLTPYQIATNFGHKDVAERLQQLSSTCIPAEEGNSLISLIDTTGKLLERMVSIQESMDSEDDSSLSLQLHTALVEAGFQRARASLQSAVADVLQQLLRDLHADNNIFLVGSFSEGWGNSLVQLNGKTDLDSDIDVTHFYGGRPFHLRGLCTCEGVGLENLFDYRNGHVEATGFATTPSLPSEGCSLKPALDRVKVYRCCCYPPVEVLTDSTRTNIPPAVVESLIAELQASNCHLATAAPPDADGGFLRVSTTFLEKRLMRSLTDLQGQLFVILKYIVKRVVSSKVSGLKSYHAKNLLFYMVDETPADEWVASNLVSLVRKALLKLIISIKCSTAEEKECMRHFFLRDAVVYFKNAAEGKARIVEVIENVMAELPKILSRFKRTLKPLDDQKLFFFHPFLTIPDIRAQVATTKASDPSTNYHEVYMLVTKILTDLSEDFCTLQSLMSSISLIPDCAFTTRECLRALALLKFEKTSEAVRTLKRSIEFPVSRGIMCQSDAPFETTDQNVREYLWKMNSTWKFFILTQRRLLMKFLPESIRETFPANLETQSGHFFLNFDALQTSLLLELCPASYHDVPQVKKWFDHVSESRDSDVQELHTSLLHCRDVSVLARQLQFQSGIVDEYAESSCLRLSYLMRLRPELINAAMVESVRLTNAELAMTVAAASQVPLT